ncbi:hypothetical protein BKK54_01790 [Rodentibacter genomosp. 1]|uniref:Thoeris protein ThsB TIR-like domain-containing protein n=1 Tax=Rodentibacter genomosp. 1 TaxID=1908264 RepID=A0A1V3J925_9PAST|nr:TIR domain-containing protein [Rodentibacter genomosp. 1]OOF51734.1 hypothetical protein BKK54_01790 [Rodentibacter genomosp. 1]
MKRRVFYSFHYQKDNWRVSQIRNIGAIEGNKIATDNEWEEVKRQGDLAIRYWINENLENRSCLIVLIGEETSTRKWVLYEIEEAWNRGMGVLGVYIENLKDNKGNFSQRGKNPFEKFNFQDDSFIPFSCIVPILDPEKFEMESFFTDLGGNSSYNIIGKNLEQYIEKAIEKRKGLGNIIKNV